MNNIKNKLLKHICSSETYCIDSHNYVIIKVILCMNVDKKKVRKQRKICKREITTRIREQKDNFK